MRRAAILVQLLLGTVLIASGCSAEGDAATSTTAATSTSVPAESSTTVESDTTADPGEAYLALAAPANCALQHYRDAYDAVFGADDYAERTQWPQIQSDFLPVSAKAADTYATFQKALLAAEWPEGAASTVEIVAGQVADQGDFFARLSRTDSFDVFIDVLQNPPEQSNSSMELRDLLGADSTTSGSDLCLLSD